MYETYELTGSRFSATLRSGDREVVLTFITLFVAQSLLLAKSQ